MTIERRMPEWRELTREVALTVLHLQHLNRQREKFRSELGTDPGLSLYLLPRQLLGDGKLVGGQPYEFLQACIADGLIKTSEAQSND
jgi:hypothetical protein